MLLTSALTGGAGDTEGQTSGSSFTLFLGEPRINNSSFLFVEMKDTMKGRGSQLPGKLARIMNCMYGTFPQQTIYLCTISAGLWVT